jgi:hypothetical protein
MIVLALDQLYGTLMRKMRTGKGVAGSPKRLTRTMWSPPLIALLLFVVCALCAHVALAQTVYSSIVGTVTDNSGAVIPDANVTVTKTETNEARQATTNEAGVYTLNTVPTGSYRVTISKSGFKRFEAENILASPNTVVRVDASLSVGEQTETINVSAETASLQTDSADVHGDISAVALEDLPQPTRTYEGAIALLPGVAPPTTNGGGTNNPVRSMQLTVNGTSGSGTNVRVDGMSATNPYVQYYSTAVPSMEAIETVNVVSATAGADEGMVNGAAVNVQIKSGTNSFHGSVYEYHIDNLMKARPYFLPTTTTKLPKLVDNDTGGTVGGPILKERLFYFGSYEGDFLHQGNSNTVSVPTDKVKAGIMTSSANPIYDPSTGNPDGTGRTAFTANTIPSGRISPIAQKVIALIPEPNLPGESNNYFVNTPSYYKLHKIDTKVDWVATDKLRIFGRFSDYPYNVTQATVFGPILSGANNALQFGNIYAISISGTYIVTPHFVVDGLFGLTHSTQSQQPPNTNVRYGQDVLGIPGSNLGNLPQGGGMPQLNFTTYSSYGKVSGALTYADPVFEYTTNASWTRGKHNLRFGMDISQQHMNHFSVTLTQLTFGGGLTALKGGPSANQYNSFAAFLLGLASTDTSSYLSVNAATLRTWQYSPYISDQWQATRKLTVAVGTRWDYYPVPTRVDRGTEFYNFQTNQFEICGEGPIPRNCGITVQKTLFSPRVGIAYRPWESTVVRAGYGLVPEQINMSRDGVGSYPIQLTYNGSGANSYTPATTLVQGIPALPNPDISSGVVPLPPGATFYTSPKNFIRGYTQSFNLTIERDLGKGWLAQIGYVGTHTLHEHTRQNVNYGLPGGGAASQPFYNGTYATGITAAETEILPNESMHYNALQSTLQHSFTHGFQVGTSYTWSKWMGLCCDANGDGAPNIPIPQYQYLNRSLMPGDRTHNLQISGVAELPFGKNKWFLRNGVAAAIAGGWQLNTVISFLSGAPFSVTADATSLNAPGSTQRANQVKTKVAILHGVGSNPYFDATAFTTVTTPTFGTASFDSLRGPGFKNADVSLFRNFRFRERYTMQARVEVLNVTNTPHFANPSAQVGTSSYDTTFATTPTSRTTDERYVRLGLKIHF